MTEKPTDYGQSVREVIKACHERRLKIERNKNRNRHSVKFPDDLEADYQAYRNWYHFNDNQALRHLVSTHPDLKIHPKNK